MQIGLFTFSIQPNQFYLPTVGGRGDNSGLPRVEAMTNQFFLPLCMCNLVDTVRTVPNLAGLSVH